MLEISGNNPDTTDEELLRQFKKSGDLEKLGEVYSRYMHLVYGVSLKYLGNRDDAGDAVMQIFEKLVTDLSGHEVLNFKSWLYVLTKNHCLMQIRSRKSEGKRVAELKTTHEFMESGYEMHPIDREDHSLEEALRQCMEKLKKEQKQCIELFYYRKLSYQEVAGKLGMELKKVKSYIQNGKRNLKICLEQQNVSQK